MTRITRIPMRRLFTGIAVAAITAVVVPLTVTATTASWTDAEWVHGEVGTGAMDCGTTTGFSTQSQGRFLGGSLLGTNLDAIAALSPQSLGLAANGTLAVSPAGSLNQGSTPPTYTYTNPLNISALGGIAGLNLTGLQVGLPVGSAGAVNQYAQVSGYGTAAGASGLVSNTGGVLVSQYATNDTLPQPATISLSSLLPVVTGVVANPQVRVGAVGSSSVLDGCAALYASMWQGDDTVTGSTRDYGIASFDLALQSAVLGAIITDTNTAVTNINTALNGLLGPTGGIATAIGGQLNVGLGSIAGVTLGATTGTVSLTGLNITGAVTPLLTAPLNDGYVSINLSAGTVDVDLASLLGGPNGLNNLGPNTQIVLNATVVNNIVTRVGTLLDTRVQQITTAITTAIRAATLNVNLSTALNLEVLGNPVHVANVGVTLSASVASVLDGTATFGVTLTLLSGLGPVVNAAVAVVIGLLNTAVAGLTTSLVSPVATAIVNAVLPLITGLGTTLSGIVTQVVSALSVVLAPLPSVLSIMVNVQPDQGGAPPGSSFIAGTATSTPQYIVSALRLGVGDGLGGLAYARLGTSSAGPVAAP